MLIVAKTKISKCFPGHLQYVLPYVVLTPPEFAFAPVSASVVPLAVPLVYLISLLASSL